MTWRPLTPCTRLPTSRSHAFAGQLAGLLHPGRELSFVELVVLVDVEVAHLLVLGRAGRERTQRGAAEEGHFDVLRETVKAEEPALAQGAIEGRVSFDRLAHAGDGAHDERVEAAPHVAFPARHGRDVGLDGGVAVGLGDLRVAACEKGRLRGVAGLGLRRGLPRLGRLRSDPLGGSLSCDFPRFFGVSSDILFTPVLRCADDAPGTRSYGPALGRTARISWQMGRMGWRKFL